MGIVTRCSSTLRPSSATSEHRVPRVKVSDRPVFLSLEMVSSIAYCHSCKWRRTQSASTTRCRSRIVPRKSWHHSCHPLSNLGQYSDQNHQNRHTSRGEHKCRTAFKTRMTAEAAKPSRCNSGNPPPSSGAVPGPQNPSGRFFAFAPNAQPSRNSGSFGRAPRSPSTVFVYNGIEQPQLTSELVSCQIP